MHRHETMLLPLSIILFLAVPAAGQSIAAVMREQGTLTSYSGSSKLSSDIVSSVEADLRRQSKSTTDDRARWGMTGGSFILLGLSIVGFAKRSIDRVRKEKACIQEMWDKETTVQQLRKLAEDNKPLPSCVLLRGRLKATGIVSAITPKVKQLTPLLGKIDQPENIFLNMAEEVKAGNINLPADSGINHSDIEIGNDELLQHNASAPSESLLVSELLITRLACEATKRIYTDKDGKQQVKIRRDPRAVRFNVLHHRQVADGLCVQGMAGESADLVLPEYDINNQEAPSLMLSLPDPMQEFNNWSSSYEIINSTTPFTHLSNFIFIDQTSKNDDGSCFDCPEGGVLETLAQTLPHGKRWYWDGKGFYDCNTGHWSTFPGIEMVSFDDYKRRMKTAAEENAQHQVATSMSPAQMRQVRDKENAFRVVELGISSTDVTVLAKPVFSDSKISLVKPDYVAPTRGSQDAHAMHFEMRILKGHTIENLIKHRNGSLKVYLGFAALGALCIIGGEEMIRNGVTVSY